MIIITMIIVIHSIYKNTFGINDILFALPILIFFIYLIIKKK